MAAAIRYQHLVLLAFVLLCFISITTTEGKFLVHNNIYTCQLSDSTKLNLANPSYVPLGLICDLQQHEVWEWRRVIIDLIRRAMMTPPNMGSKKMMEQCQMRVMIYLLWITLQQVKSLQSTTKYIQIDQFLLSKYYIQIERVLEIQLVSIYAR